MHHVKIRNGSDARYEKPDVFWKNLFAGRTETDVIKLLINEFQLNISIQIN